MKQKIGNCIKSLTPSNWNAWPILPVVNTGPKTPPLNVDDGLVPWFVPTASLNDGINALDMVNGYSWPVPELYNSETAVWSNSDSNVHKASIFNPLLLFEPVIL